MQQTAEAGAKPVQTVDIDALIHDDSVEYGLNEEHFKKVMSCESGRFANVAVQSQDENPDGTQERSYGLAQINLDAHPEITIEQATDPVFALKWAAEQWSEGNAQDWTCYRLLYQ